MMNEPILYLLIYIYNMFQPHIVLQHFLYYAYLRYEGIL